MIGDHKALYLISITVQLDLLRGMSALQRILDLHADLGNGRLGTFKRHRQLHVMRLGIVGVCHDHANILAVDLRVQRADGSKLKLTRIPVDRLIGTHDDQKLVGMTVFKGILGGQWVVCLQIDPDDRGICIPLVIALTVGEIVIGLGAVHRFGHVAHVDLSNYTAAAGRELNGDERKRWILKHRLHVYVTNISATGNPIGKAINIVCLNEE